MSFQLRSENAIVKREAEQAIREAGVQEVLAPPPPQPQTIDTNEPPKELLDQLETLKVKIAPFQIRYNVSFSSRVKMPPCATSTTRLGRLGHRRRLLWKRASWQRRTSA